MHRAALAFAGLVCFVPQIATAQSDEPLTRIAVGFEQSALVGSKPSPHWLLDFFLDLPLSKAKDPMSFFHVPMVWTNVRLTSEPSKADANIASFLGSFDVAPSAFKAQEIAQGIQVTGGLQVPLYTGGTSSSPNGEYRYHLSAIAAFGVEAPFAPDDKTAIVFEVNDAVRARYPDIASETMITFLGSDRDRFYRRWLTGIRFRTYKWLAGSGTTAARWAGFPGQFDLTIGQSEVMSAGVLKGAVVTLEGFSPLPFVQSNTVYFFGSIAFRPWQPGEENPRLILKPVTEAVAPHDPRVYVNFRGTPDRDLWKIGVAVDLASLWKSR